MSYCFRVVAGSMDVLESFCRNQIQGVSISHESVVKPELRETMAYDSAEGILQFIVHAALDIDIGLFTTWLYENVSKPSRKKTIVNGLPVPADQAELAALIVKLMNQQKNSSENVPSKDES